jgi:hypothetical protein
MQPFRDHSWKILLILGIILGLIFLSQRIVHKRGLAHDEPISYIEATGHLSDFAHAQLNLSTRWTDAAQWKQYWHPDEKFCFATIRADVSAHDVSPPFYFWCLHVWLLCVGVNLWGGPVLNILFWLATCGLLFHIARRVLGEPLPACLVVFLWALSPQTHEIINHTRLYALLGCLALAHVLLVLRTLEPDRRFSVGLFLGSAATTAFGLLTHFHFMLLIGACTLVVLFQAAIRKKPRPLLPFLGATGAGLALFVLLHPRFLDSFLGGRSAGLGMDTRYTYYRAVDFVLHHGTFFVPIHFVKAALITLAVLLGGAGIVYLWKKRRITDLSLRGADRPEVHLGLVYLILLTVTVTLYILGFSPLHAVSARYHTMLYPLLAFFPVLLLKGLPGKIRTVLLVLLCCWQAAYGAIQTAAYIERQEGIATHETLPAKPETYFLDSVARGELPRILFSAPDEARVFAAWQDTLLAYPERYIEGIGDSTLYVSSPRFFNTAEKRERIIAFLLNRGFTPEPASDNFLSVGEAVWLTRGSTGGNARHP